MAKLCRSLNLLYYPFRIKLERTLDEAARQGIPCRVFETWRSRARQAELFAQGRGRPGPRVTSARPGETYHHYGVAADLVMWVDDQWQWGPPEYYARLGPIGEAAGLTWLGRTTSDLAHFQLTAVPTVYTLMGIYNNHGLEGVWFQLDANSQRGPS